ncbi:hypothetical protein [Iningainema tapete]|uniref:Uncharacterized protein n=1 Tax=Iningainema tapete BLCC-T55 TaxID=2748662 RepID=A0A8J6XDU8_9CYAN|nr:hypothetical protein [Iningainema tapete]MBD2770562.1 hypothetical protein [Iningainema tapete BLCC-T55]
MKIKGIKRGKTIELSEELNIPDAQEVLIEILDAQLINEEERHQKLKELFAISLEDRQEWVKIGEELDRERKADIEKQKHESTL